MANEQKLTKLVGLLKELFQLDQPDLDWLGTQFVPAEVACGGRCSTRTSITITAHGKGPPDVYPCW